MKNYILVGVAILLLAFAAWRLTGRRSGKLNLSRPVLQPAVCLNCQQEIDVERPFGEAPPYKCPACDQRTACPWWYCYDCHWRFVPELRKTEDGRVRPEGNPVCTHCGCANVSEWYPASGTQTPMGDAPLPHLP